jgi:GNAT superfamily N-acetyltransferase
MQKTVTTTYLELRDQADYRPSLACPADASLARIDPPMPAVNASLYAAVGGPWSWTDRLAWSEADWLAYLSAGVETWVLSVGGVRAGYFELDPRSGDPEVAYCGLLPDFIGRGLGGFLMTAAIDRAWHIGRRVWVHTCSLDHPSALAAYQARGFRVYREEVSNIVLPPASGS